MDALEMIKAALDALGTRVVGLVVEHNGYTLQLNPDVDNRGWSALGYPDAEDENGYPVQVVGDGPTPEMALDKCADECRESEDMVLG